MCTENDLFSLPSDEEISLCDFYWSNCFFLSMSNSSRRGGVCKSGCAIDCEGVEYGTDVTSADLREQDRPA